MRRILPAFTLLALTSAPTAVTAGGYNRVYLVPAVTACPGPASCVPRTFESAYTFDTILLRTPATKYSAPDKPSFVLEVRGVKSAAGALVDGTLSLRIKSGRVSLPSLGTFPDDSPLTVVAPVVVPLKGGRGRVAYKPATGTPAGIITNGGGAEVLDPDGKLLAVTGSQTKP